MSQASHELKNIHWGWEGSRLDGAPSLSCTEAEKPGWLWGWLEELPRVWVTLTGNAEGEEMFLKLGPDTDPEKKTSKIR